MKQFHFIGNDEYIYDATTNTLHYCKYLTDDCSIDHLTSSNSLLISNYSKNPNQEVVSTYHKVPIKCPHCFHE